MKVKKLSPRKWYSPERLLFLLIAAAWAFVAVFPMYMVINILFSPRSDAVFVNFHWLPTSLTEGLSSIQRVLKDSQFISGTLVSVAYGVFQALGMLLIASMAAFEFSLFEFPGKRPLFLIALSSMMIPQAVTIIPAFRVVISLGWVNTLQGLAVPGMASASGLFILTQFMETIPKELLHSASIDGANHFTQYWRIALPLSKNSILTAGILCFLGAWGNLMWPLVVISLPNLQPMSYVVTKYASAFSTLYPLNVQLAAMFLASIPPLILFVVFQRFIINGIATSGLKG
ncbi:sn-glycerol-3-phosphate transport system permease protein UgpE [Spirochaetia bacterium]|nr:sn-glycerol-3-phosphate transport system permease protein UgpE [Spirochaetia bacterium]